MELFRPKYFVTNYLIESVPKAFYKIAILDENELSPGKSYPFRHEPIYDATACPESYVASTTRPVLVGIHFLGLAF